MIQNIIKQERNNAEMKTKKELRKFALKNRFKLGGFRYNKDYEPMVDLAY